jgi:hypothetical protein
LFDNYILHIGYVFWQVVYGRVARAAVLQQLREHLRRNLVRFGKTWHCQSQGIPQVGVPPPWLLVCTLAAHMSHPCKPL